VDRRFIGDVGQESTSTADEPAKTLVGRHPLLAYFVLTYAISWPLWLLAPRVGGTVGTGLVVAGGFGPAAAAAVIIRRSGGSLRDWAGGILRWRLPLRYYLYALGLPALIMLAMNLALAVIGSSVAWSSLPDRAPAYLQTLLLTAVIFGGQEEPGWRGYALPRLQARHSPVVATLILGLGWGIWHVPLYGPAGFVVPLVLAFFYTWLYNNTVSVLLCMLLHASFTAAQDDLLLTADSPVVDAVLFSTYLVAAVTLIAASRSRLGQRRPAADADHGDR
jgi:membrane protease YdiL (CAAX protease family)